MSNEKNFISSLQQLINQSQADRSFDGIGITRNKELAAMASKLRRPIEEKRIDPSKNDGSITPIVPMATQISRTIMSRVEDSENTFKLFPDIELCALIIVASIVSPKDMLKTEVNFKLESTDWPATLSNEISDLIRREVTESYKFFDEIYDILYEALFLAGSHVKLVLPEAAVDYLINHESTIATESIRNAELFENDFKRPKALGHLGSPSETTSKVSAMESMFSGVENRAYDPSLFVKQVQQPEDGDVNLNALQDLAKENLEVYDNYHFLKVPELIEKSRKQKIADISNTRLKLVVGQVYASENYLREKSSKLKPTPNEMKNMLYKSATTGYMPSMAVPSKMNLRRRSVGRPLVMTLPPESVIPIYLPGNYKKHVGYFIMTDLDGNPVTVDSVMTEYGNGYAAMQQSDRLGAAGTGSLLTDRAKKNIITDNYTPVIEQMAVLYSEIVERDLLQRLSKGGIYNQELEVSMNTEISRIMLARALQSKMTRLVYVPAEYVTYFAFKYHRNGVGRSYLDDLSNITSMRAMVLFSQVWAQVKSSISVVKTHLVFDPRDADPYKTIEVVKHLLARSRQQMFPNGLKRYGDFTDWIQRAGIELSWEGHPQLPNTTMDTEAKNLEHTLPNGDLEENLRHLTYMHFGLTPETVDAARREDFATSVTSRGILLSKRIMMLGKFFNIDMTDYVQKLVANDEVIQDKIIEIFEANQKDVLGLLKEEDQTLMTNGSAEDRVRITRRLMNEVINRIRLSVPEPDSTSNINMKTEIEEYEAILDKVLDNMVGSEVLVAGLVGDEASQFAETAKQAMKAELMRRFFTENNIVREAFDIVEKGEDGMPTARMSESIQNFTMNVAGVVLDLLKRSEGMKDAITKDMEKMSVSMDNSGSDFEGDNTSPDNDGTGGFEDFDVNGGEPPIDDMSNPDDEGTGGNVPEEEEGEENKTPPEEE